MFNLKLRFYVTDFVSLGMKETSGFGGFGSDISWQCLTVAFVSSSRWKGVVDIVAVQSSGSGHVCAAVPWQREVK